MKLQVPVINEDGSVQFIADLSAQETQVIMQFGLNLALTAGLAQFIAKDEPEEQHQLEFDFPEGTTVQ